MKKSELTSKYVHQLTLKNYSENTLRAYLNGLNIFLGYVSTNQVQEITSEVLGSCIYHCKKDPGYGYSMISPGLF